MFCAGANIQMLAGSSHGHKVNFCKFTNETRNAIEDASANSGQTWIAAVNGTAAGGGYELALACDEILLVDDRASAVSLPEVPLLAVLPGTGGLTRLVDKRHVRRDLADVFATRAEGVKGQQAVDWGLVDAVAPRTAFDELVHARALARAAESDRPDDAPGVDLTPLQRELAGDEVRYEHVTHHHRSQHRRGPHHRAAGRPGRNRRRPTSSSPPAPTAWLLATARQLDDAVLQLRFNEPELGTWILRTEGSADDVVAAEAVLADDHWLAREIRLYWGSHAQASRSLGANAGRPRRARQLLRRDARRAGPRRRPHADARRHAGGRRAPGRDHAAHPCQRRLVPDGERPVPPGDPLLGSRRDASSAPAT